MKRLIQRYERELIEIGDQGLTDSEFNALVRWNQRNANRFFEVGHRRLWCKQFVGVVQVGGLVIEILPKADRGDADHARWHQALLTMLRIAHGLKLHTADEADLALRRTNLMDLFLAAYVKEVRGLVHTGLVKKYHAQRSQQHALKGRLDFPNHLRSNLVHRERFAVVHQAYDTDHLLHSILKEALEIVERSCTNTIIVGDAQDVNWAFEQVQARPIGPSTFERVRMDRKTAPYASALSLARMIILNYNPDLRSGGAQVLSILFDMERLWERFINRLLAARCPAGWTIGEQEKQPFWEERTVRPDLVFMHRDRIRLIGDTKWKVPDDDEPSIEDLRQMFAYNIRFVSERSVLLYPGSPRSLQGRFINHNEGWHQTEHGCEVRFMMPFDAAGAIDEVAVQDLIQAIMGEEITVR